jgi:hypothetical protein
MCHPGHLDVLQFAGLLHGPLLISPAVLLRQGEPDLFICHLLVDR